MKTEMNVETIEKPTANTDYFALNALLNLVGEDGRLQLDADKEATRQYFLNHVNQNTVFFHSLEEKIEYLVDNDYYEEETLEQYTFDNVKKVFQEAYSFEFRFKTFLGAYTYYTSYTLKTFNGERYLERYEDRVSMVALYLAQGDFDLAMSLVDEMMSGRFQPATPTFLNAGRAQRGELVSCYLLRVEDNMESISRGVNASLQLSKRGGGVALNLTNLRETGSPIKKIENASSGVVPVMKILEDSFSYANQLGARQGAGAVYLHAHHPDIVNFLDTKRENADEKVRIKTLSLGVVIPDITFELAKRNEDMYLFSPYDVEREYGVAFTEVDVTKEYYNMVENQNIRKKVISARKLFSMIAEIQFESGYPYIMYVDNANNQHHVPGKISMSNLCSEIMQASTPSEYNDDLSYKKMGNDISCNLGSLNIAAVMDTGNFSKTVKAGMEALTAVSELSNISVVPSIEKGNRESHAVGLSAMNLHGYLAREEIHYDSPEAVDFTNLFFYLMNYESVKASSEIAKDRGKSFVGFEESDYYNGKFFEKYIEKDWSIPKSEKVASLFEKAGIRLPTPEDWKKLAKVVQKTGMYNKYRLTQPPTGSVSYLSDSTPAIQPIPAPIEARKTGKIGRIYRAAPFMTNDNIEYYRDAYALGPDALINIYAAAQQHVDQSLSLTLFFTDKATTRDLNKAYITAWTKGIKSIYYIRIRGSIVEGTEIGGMANDYCESCQL